MEIIVAILILIGALGLQLASLAWCIKSSYYTYGLTGDAAAYFFHYQDQRSKTNRCLLGSTLRPLNPWLLFIVARLVPDQLIQFRPFYLKSATEIGVGVIFCVAMLIDGYSYSQALIFLSAKLYFSAIAVPLLENRQMYTFSPRLIGQELTSALFIGAIFFKEPTLSTACAMALGPVALNNSHFSRQFLVFLAIPLLIWLQPVNSVLLLAAIFFSILLKCPDIETLISQYRLFKMQVRRLSRPRLDRDEAETLRALASNTAGEGKESIALLAFVWLAGVASNATSVSVIAGVALAFSLLVATRYLEFIGEHWRYALYINSALVPFFLTDFLHAQPFVCLIMLLIKAVLSIVQYKKANRECWVNNNALLLEALLECKFEKKKNKICWLSQSFREGTLAVNLGYGVYTTEFPIGRLGEIEELREGYPLLDLEKAMQSPVIKNAVTHVILEKKWTGQVSLANRLFSLHQIADTNNYAVFEIKEVYA